jgi:hypothetical protein
MVKTELLHCHFSAQRKAERVQKTKKAKKKIPRHDFQRYSQLIRDDTHETLINRNKRDVDVFNTRRLFNSIKKI